MTPFRAAGLIYGPELHHLDHLAPLCCLLGIPLLTTEESIAALAKRYYPGIEVLALDYMAAPEYLVTHFDLVFYSMPRDVFDEVFFIAQKMAQKRVHTIWCPHGNSDKGNAIFFMEALKKEEAALVYGKQMIEFLKRKGVFDQLKGHAIVGHYRRQFYNAHKPFYDALAEQEIFRRLPAAKRTLFYAPTWQDYEKSSSFFNAMPPLAETLPAEHNLIVKLHPNLLLQDEFNVETLIEHYGSAPNIHFIREFPPVYACLSKVNAYIGDMSSIGYDFLTFNRPMFFLNQQGRDAKMDAGLYLFRCGVEVPKEDYGDIHGIIDRYFQYEVRDFSEIRKDNVRTWAGYDFDKTVKEKSVGDS